MKIGVFDSGRGGLEILRALQQALPHYDYVFYGDTAHVPYGDKTEAEVYELTCRGVEALFKADAVLVILACNTASAETARRLQQEYLPNTYPDRKILGVIIPTVEALIESGATSVTLLGTRRTVASNKYETELQKISAAVKLKSVAVPGLVPLIESGNYQAAAKELDKILEPLPAGEVVVMGCTHYSSLDPYLSSEQRSRLTILYQTDIIPEKLRKYLDAHREVAGRLGQGKQVEYIFTGHSLAGE